jgi:hypothetical protein
VWKIEQKKLLANICTEIGPEFESPLLDHLPKVYERNASVWCIRITTVTRHNDEV